MLFDCLENHFIKAKIIINGEIQYFSPFVIFLDLGGILMSLLDTFYNNNIPGSFLLKVGRGIVNYAKPLIKIGLNFDVGTTAEIVAPQGGTLTYLTSAEQLVIVSSSVNDIGGVRIQGTITDGTDKYLEDTNTDFVSAGVQVGDVVIDDTTSAIGVISSVETNRLYVYKFQYDGINKVNAGDSYRVVYSNGTGAALIRLEGVDANYDLIQDWVVLNGTTSVTSSKSFLRVNNAEVYLAGSLGFNDGAISIKDSTETYELLQIYQNHNKALNGYWTVPKGYTFYLLQGCVSEASNKGATTFLYVRPYGHIFQLRYAINTLDGTAEVSFPCPMKIDEMSDVEVRAVSNLGGANIAISLHGWYEKV